MRLFRGIVCGGVAASALVLGFASSAQAAAVTVADWKMNDSGTTMADSTGRGHTGTLHSVTVGQPGWSSTSFGFLKTPSYVSVPSATDLNPGTSNFSYTVHVRFSTKPSASVVDYDLVRKGLSTTSGGSYKMEILQSGVAYCNFRGTSGGGTLTGSTNLATNTWHTITCARTSSTIRLTVDGVTKSKTVTTGSISNSSTLYIGAKDGGGADQYRGLMDAVTVSKG